MMAERLGSEATILNGPVPMPSMPMVSRSPAGMITLLYSARI